MSTRAPDPRSIEVAVERRTGGDARRALDAVAAEEPLEIAIEGDAIAVVMRTPGDDEDLVRGFLLTEGIVLHSHEVAAVQLDGEGRADALLAPGVEIDTEQFRRSMFTSSSCGVCGKASIEAVMLHAPPAEPVEVSSAVVARLTDVLRTRQPTFDATGGLHAAGVFDLDGEALVVREDVGRHNAVDKAIGAFAREHAAEAGDPRLPALLVVSGRQSFEIVQKAAMARLAGVVGVSAPSSLAVDLARELGLLLVGFAREGDYNVYAGAERLVD
ncbi:MAG: formate dehydrogenase accessory sulfurtransferase FdhD [Chloroflexi bacterium]|nr:formate dehydrogenase accessory sulfurtransferase FdhD [Chloroflexota bacterium]